MLSTKIQPSFAEFKKQAKKANVIPLSLEIAADHITPVSLLSSQWTKSSHCFLLESVEGGEQVGRYSIVSFEPESIIEEKNDQAILRTPSGRVLQREVEPALDFLKKTMGQYKVAPQPGLPRFYGGAVGYCSYETVHQMERVPKTNPDDLKWPSSTFFIARDLFVFDNAQQTLKLIVCAKIKNKSDVKAAYARAKRRIAQGLEVLRSQKGMQKISSRKPKAKKAFTSNVNEPAFKRMVQKAKGHIAKGDIFQVVLSRRSEKETHVSPLEIYRALRIVNPSPYLYLMKIGERSVIGSSPEALVRLEEGVASTRPIAGTRPRGASAELDKKLEQTLLADPKERAEHVMLVDLGRNDLGRVCRFGSVRVPRFMSVERYSHVMHIVSDVVGKMKSRKDAFDLLKAVFPAGTVSGAPKIRAMEIIDDLEKTQRGPYAGALGYIGFSGNMDMAITIRTILWDKGHVSIQTGAGIVADSNPTSEFKETENKAAGMKETIRLAESGDLFLDS